MKNFLAFTLAETLIVIGIIGVVAALTLPNLNSSTGDKEKVVKLKKIYSNLNDAMGRAIAVYGPYNEWNNNVTKAGDRLTEFMKLSKNCGVGSESCMETVANTSLTNSPDMNIGSSSLESNYTFICADGTAVAISVQSNSIYVDIDGKNSGINKTGKDVFGFSINTSTGEITPKGPRDDTDRALGEECLQLGGSNCTKWVIENENLDYLKCSSKLSVSNITCK